MPTSTHKSLYEYDLSLLCQYYLTDFRTYLLYRMGGGMLKVEYTTLQVTRLFSRYLLCTSLMVGMDDGAVALTPVVARNVANAAFM